MVPLDFARDTHKARATPPASTNPTRIGVPSEAEVWPSRGASEFNVLLLHPRMFGRFLLRRRHRQSQEAPRNPQRRQRPSVDGGTPARSPGLDRRTLNIVVRAQARKSTKALEPREEGCFGQGFPSTALRTSSRSKRVNLRLPPPPNIQHAWEGVQFSRCTGSPATNGSRLGSLRYRRSPRLWFLSFKKGLGSSTCVWNRVHQKRCSRRDATVDFRGHGGWRQCGGSLHHLDHPCLRLQRENEATSEVRE